MAAQREPKTPDEWIKRFIKAAEQRWTSAEYLYKNEMFIDQMYLTGYVVECAMKALILRDTPRSKRKEVLTLITRGREAHDYEHLRAIYRRFGAQFPRDGARLLQKLILQRWTTSYRYVVGPGDREEAEQFLGNAKEFLEWVRRRLP